MQQFLKLSGAKETGMPKMFFEKIYDQNLVSEKPENHAQKHFCC